MKKHTGRQVIHGLSRHPLYSIRSAIIRRCYNKRHHDYESYGGRGIYICDEWEKDMSSFIRWCEDNGWVKGLTIDRIDNNDGYRPGNIRFVTLKENNRNTRRNIFITINGVTKNISEWCEINGVSQKMFYGRTKVYGWSIEKALTMPVYGKDGVGFRCPKLTESQVDKIRTAYSQGGITQLELSKEYNVSGSLISMIVNKRRRA